MQALCISRNRGTVKEPVAAAEMRADFGVIDERVVALVLQRRLLGLQNVHDGRQTARRSRAVVTMMLN